MKVLLFDIETAPSRAYVWSFWKQNISDEMVTDYGGYIMSVALKWLGSDEVFYFENRTENDKEVVTQILKFFDEADFVIGHNGKKFDVPFVKTRAVMHKLPPPSPFKVIDTLIIAKKEMSFKRNTLKHLAESLNVPLRKLDHEKFKGFSLWSSCIDGVEEAWKEMRLYNIMDVEVLEQVYLRLRPWYQQHPNTTTADDGEVMCCPKCGSDDLIRRGYYFTNKGKYQRYSCKSCGGWSSSTYVQNTIEKRKSLLASR